MYLFVLSHIELYVTNVIYIYFSTRKYARVELETRVIGTEHFLSTWIL